MEQIDGLVQRSCPLCSSEGPFQIHLTCRDYTVSKELFDIVKCPSCDLHFTNPVPPPEKLGLYYKSESYISHSDTKKGLVAKLYHLVRSYALRQKLGIVSRHVSRGTLLDFGCGTGAFLNFAQEREWNAVGFEPDSGAADLATRSGARVYSELSGIQKNIPDSSLNAITMWHVLEHVFDLRQTMEMLLKKLAVDGKIIIAVPNYQSSDARRYGEHWAAYDVPRHLYHFSPDTVSRLFDAVGLRLIKTYPMRFDSYYVSLLSEKYSRGRMRLVPALLSGLKSNWSARGPEGYSSVIYVGAVASRLS